MRRTIIAALGVAVAGTAALPALAATKSITVGDNYFVKRGGATVSVKRGTTVRWVFRGDRKHTVVGTGSASFINSGDPRRDGSYKLKMSREGTFRIVCTLHSDEQRMTLKVR